MITWNDLAIEGKDALAFAVENKFVRGVSKFELAFDEWPFIVTNRLHELGLIEPLISDSTPNPEYTLYAPTAAGRALLPAGEAVDDEPAFPVGEMRYVAAEPVGAKSAFDMMLADYESLSDKIATLQAELAAALARAQAAEGEVQRLRETLEQVADELTSAATDNRYGAERNWESYWHSACTASSIAEEVLDR